MVYFQTFLTHRGERHRAPEEGPLKTLSVVKQCSKKLGVSFCVLFGLFLSHMILLPSQSWGTPSDCKIEKNTIADRDLFDDFSHALLDKCKWIVVQNNWGGQVDGEDYNGGVVKDNVAVKDSRLHLQALGNHYSGPVRGIDSKDKRRSHGRRTGAAIMTAQRYLGGRFEARVKIAAEFGVCSAMWTYINIAPPGEDVVNHEIDIEFPGRAHIDAPPSFDHVALTNWIGLKPGQSTTVFRKLKKSAGEFQVLRFDWYPAGQNTPGKIDYYIDDELIYTSNKNIPSTPAPLWLGVWFPKDWAGIPNFDQTVMQVDWVRISSLKNL